MENIEGGDSPGERRRRRQARDARLVEAIRGEDPAGFGRLVDTWLDPVVDVVARLVRRRDDALALTGEVFAQVWRRLPSLEPPQALGPWLLRIARELALDRAPGASPGAVAGPERARRAASADAEADAAEAEGAGAEQLASASSIADALAADAVAPLVWMAAQTLTARDLSMLDLHLRHGLAAGESAVTLGLNPGAAEALIEQLRSQLAVGVRAAVLWQGGEPICDELANRLRRFRVEGFDVHAARLIERHAADCKLCRARQRLSLDPVDLFASLPLVAITPAERASVVAALDGDGIPVGPVPRAPAPPPPEGTGPIDWVGGGPGAGAGGGELAGPAGPGGRLAALGGTGEVTALSVAAGGPPTEAMAAPGLPVAPANVPRPDLPPPPWAPGSEPDLPSPRMPLDELVVPSRRERRAGRRPPPPASGAGADRRRRLPYAGAAAAAAVVVVGAVAVAARRGGEDSAQVSTEPSTTPSRAGGDAGAPAVAPETTDGTEPPTTAAPEGPEITADAAAPTGASPAIPMTAPSVPRLAGAPTAAPPTAGRPPASTRPPTTTPPPTAPPTVAPPRPQISVSPARLASGWSTGTGPMLSWSVTGGAGAPAVVTGPPAGTRYDLLGRSPVADVCPVEVTGGVCSPPPGSYVFTIRVGDQEATAALVVTDPAAR